MMASGEYEKGKTAPILAARWGLSPKTIENEACEAKRLHELTTDKDAARLDLNQFLIERRSDVERLARSKNERVAVEALRVVKPLVDSHIELSGLAAPKAPVKIEHSGAVGLTDVDEIRKAMAANAGGEDEDG